MRIPSEDIQKRIVDTIRYRFYDRLDLYDVYRWLDNFEDGEQELAVSVFESLEYCREEDLLDILRKGILHILDDAWNEMGKSVHLHFIPLGKPGKSGHAISYLVKNLLKTNAPQHTKSVSFYGSPKELNLSVLTDQDIVIFLDDIIGSGDTFTAAVNLTITKKTKDGDVKIPNEWTIGHVVKENTAYRIALLSCFIMDKGEARLKADYPYMKLYGEERIHAFSKGKSPFGGYLKMKNVREFCYKYGSLLCPGKELGYSNSQALLLFAHAIPNNTLPIIWVDEYMENGSKKNWTPLIPRNQLKKADMSFVSRMDNNRWVFKLSQYFGVDPDYPEWKGIINEKSVKLTYLLRCLEKRIPEVVIANDMGLTNEDMTCLFKEGIELGLWDENHHVIADASAALADANKIINIRDKHDTFIAVDDRNYMYVPETFRGKS